MINLIQELVTSLVLTKTIYKIQAFPSQWPIQVVDVALDWCMAYSQHLSVSTYAIDGIDDTAKCLSWTCNQSTHCMSVAVWVLSRLEIQRIVNIETASCRHDHVWMRQIQYTKMAQRRGLCGKQWAVSCSGVNENEPCCWIWQLGSSSGFRDDVIAVG